MQSLYTILTPRLRLEALALSEVRALAATSVAGVAARAAVAARLRAALPDEWPGPQLALALPVIAEEMAAEGGDARWVWVVIAPGEQGAPGARVIGDVGFHGPLRDGGSAEVGYTLAPETRGRGYATEACAALLAWVWAQTGVIEVTAQIEASNAASLRVAAKLSMLPLAPDTPGHLRFGVGRPPPT